MSHHYVKQNYGCHCFYNDSAYKRYNRAHLGGDTLIFNFNCGCGGYMPYGAGIGFGGFCGGMVRGIRSFWGGLGAGMGFGLMTQGLNLLGNWLGSAGILSGGGSWMPNLQGLGDNLFSGLQNNFGKKLLGKTDKSSSDGDSPAKARRRSGKAGGDESSVKTDDSTGSTNTTTSTTTNTTINVTNTSTKTDTTAAGTGNSAQTGAVTDTGTGAAANKVAARENEKADPDNLDKATDAQLEGMNKEDILSLTIPQAEKLRPEQAKVLLKTLGLIDDIDDSEAKLGIKPAELALLQKSGLKVTIEHGTAGNDYWIKGPISKLHMDEETGALSYDVDCADIGKIGERYTFTQKDKDGNVFNAKFADSANSSGKHTIDETLDLRYDEESKCLENKSGRVLVK